jgi:methionyl-tRNA synthetase
MAKDNIPFHTIMFPAAIIGSGEPWKLADYIKGFNWLNYYGGKFSTSRRHGVFMDSALEVLPADYWRYFLIANAPESDDATFTWEQFAVQVNKDLADTLGNLVNRVLTFSRKRFDDTVPAAGPAGEAERRLGEHVAQLLASYERELDELQFRKAAQQLRAIWSAGNVYLNEKAPWRAVKDDVADAKLTLATAMNLIHLIGLISEPIIPETARTIQGIFDLAPGDRGWNLRWPDPAGAAALDFVPAGRSFRVPPVLFRKITDDDVAAWRERFGAGALS